MQKSKRMLLYHFLSSEEKKKCSREPSLISHKKERHNNKFHPNEFPRKCTTLYTELFSCEISGGYANAYDFRR